MKKFSERAAVLVIVAVVLATGFLAYGITKLSSSTDFREFLPEDSPAVRTTEEFENNFGSATEIILVEADNVTNAEIFRAINDLENRIRTDPELDGYVLTVSSYVDYVLPFLPLGGGSPDPMLEGYIQAALEQPGVASVVDRTLSSSHDAALITVSTASGLSVDERTEKTESFVKLVQDYDENDENIKLGVTGDLTLSNEIFGLMGRDNQILIPAAGVFVIVILFLVFRRFSDIGIPLLAVALGAVWAIGAMAWLGMKFTMIHVALIPLVLGLGIDYSIHILNRYYEERNKGTPANVAVLHTTRTTGVAVALAAVTTMIGFGSFMLSDMPPLVTLGIFSAVGVATTFFLATTFLPALLVLRDRKGGKIKALVARRGKRVDKVLSAVAIGAEHHGRTIITVAVLAAVVGGVAVYGISTSMSFETFLPGDIPSIVALNDIENQFGGQSTIFVLARGEVRSPGGLQSMLDVENTVLTDGDDLITSSLSLASTISKLPGGIPQSELAINAILENENLLDPGLRDRLLKDNLAVIYFYVDAKTDQEMAEASDIIKSHVSENPGDSIDMSVDGEPAVGGEPVIIGNVMGSITVGMARTTIFALFSCLVVLVVAFRSPLFGAMALMPLVLTVGWEFGVLRTLGWSLNVLTMGISALVIGIGIDYAIHIVHRFREERRRRGNELERAIRKTVMHVGTALLAAAATTMGVFGVLALSQMPALMMFGTLAALVIFFAFVSALVVLPSMLVIVRRRGTSPKSRRRKLR